MKLGKTQFCQQDRKIGITIDMLTSNGVWANVAHRAANIGPVLFDTPEK